VINFSELNEQVFSVLDNIAQEIRRLGYVTSDPGYVGDGRWDFLVTSTAKDQIDPPQTSVDVSLEFIHSADEDKYWPTIDIVAIGGRMLGAFPLSDELIEPDDIQAFRRAIDWASHLVDDVASVIEQESNLKKGPKEWSPRKPP
jgi:hypothetical protein